MGHAPAGNFRRLHEGNTVEIAIVALVVVLSVATWLIYKLAAGLQVKK